MNASARARWRNHDYAQKQALITDYWRARILEEIDKLQELLSDDDYEAFVARLPEEAFWYPILQRARAYLLAHLGASVDMDELVRTALDKPTIAQNGDLKCSGTIPERNGK